MKVKLEREPLSAMNIAKKIARLEMARYATVCNDIFIAKFVLAGIRGAPPFLCI
jgi:hypothetical protein